MGPEVKSSKEKEEQRTVINVTDGALIPEKGRKGALLSWGISFFGAIAALVILPIVSSKPYVEILGFIILPAVPAGQSLDLTGFFSSGLVITFSVTIVSILAATILGLFAGLGQVSRNIFISTLSGVYVQIIRGIPLAVQIFYVYFVLGGWLKLPGIVAAMISLTVCYGAYIAEIFRAGLQSINKGQYEASIALGLTRTQTLWKILIPQTFRNILPAIGNEFIALLKDSSLVSIIAIQDTTLRTKQFATRTFDYFEAFTVVALIYLVITLGLSRLVALLEERMNKNGR